MASTIREYVAERSINNLLHFTRECNLDSILQRGLVTRDVLMQEGYASFNDLVRVDYTDAVCLSIGFPNYKMWYGLKEDNKDVDWVIVAVAPSAIWELPCAFCRTNAASGSVTAVPLAERQTLAAFQAMYADPPGKERVILNIPDDFTTDPQAEVLMLQGIPKHYIFGVVVLNATQQMRLQARYPGLKIFMLPHYFSYRKDWAHWKTGA